MTSFGGRPFGRRQAWISFNPETEGQTVAVQRLDGCDGWAAVSYFTPDEDGVLRLRRLEIACEADLQGRDEQFAKAFPNPSDTEIAEVGSVHVRAIRLQALHQRAHDTARHFRQLVDVEKDRSRPGRRGRSDRYYAEWAAKYTALLGSPKPLETLSSQEHLSVSQIRNILGMARRRDLLTRAPRGRAGGRLTEKAVRLLAERRDED